MSDVRVIFLHVACRWLSAGLTIHCMTMLNLCNYLSVWRLIGWKTPQGYINVSTMTLNMLLFCFAVEIRFCKSLTQQEKKIFRVESRLWRCKLSHGCHSDIWCNDYFVKYFSVHWNLSSSSVLQVKLWLSNSKLFAWGFVQKLRVVSLIEHWPKELCGKGYLKTCQY